MKYIFSLCIVSLLLTTPIEATKVVQCQLEICPKNPHLVKEVGSLSPEEREQLIQSIKQSSSFIRKASWGSGIAAVGSFGMLAYAESWKAKIGSAGLATLFTAATCFLHLASIVGTRMANSEKLVETEVSPDTTLVLAGVSEGIYPFCVKGSHPCNLLHNEIQSMQALPNLPIYDLDADSDEAKKVIKNMGISVIGYPTTVVVKNHTIACIIFGYHSSDDFEKKVNDSLKN